MPARFKLTLSTPQTTPHVRATNDS
jgi:hypothetical protein